MMKKRNTIEGISIYELWNVLKKYYYDHAPVIGTIIGYNEHFGFTVDVDGVHAEMPWYELSHARIDDFNSFVGLSCYFVITNIDVYRKHLKLSRKKYAERLKVNDVVTGIVEDILDNRMYVDVGFSVRIKIRNMADFFIQNISNIFSIGQKIEIILLEDYCANKYTEAGSKSSDIWKAKTCELNIDDMISAKVTDIASNGLKVVVRNNLECFVHENFLTTDYRERLKSEEIKVGETIEVAITKIEEENHKILLSMNRVAVIKAENAKQDLKSQIERGTVLEARVVDVERNFAKILIEGTEVIVPMDRKHLSTDKVIDARSVVFPGELLNVVYLGEEDGNLIFSRKLLTTSTYSTDIYDLSLDELLLKQGIDKNLFVGKAVKMGDDIFFHDVASVGNSYDGESFFEGRLLQDYVTATPSIVLVQNKNWANELSLNEYYQFSISLAPKQIRISQGSPFVYQVDFGTRIKHLPNPYKRAVEQVFSKQESPEQNKIIASLLREVGSQLYSEKSRMLFELLQNADDASPSRNQDIDETSPRVQVSIKIDETGILFQHNGCAFNFEDFKSITSAANSTKGIKKRSTGYKGIGFKSVFTNSTTVFILSRGFRFGFNKNAPIFDVSEFDELYRKVRNFSSTQEEKNFFTKYAEQRSRYGGIDDIPWQIMPFWEGDIKSNISLKHDIKNDENVVIGLMMDELSRNEYEDAIQEVFDNPRMFLFLRHTRRLQFSRLGKTVPQTIQKSYDQNNQTITLFGSNLNCGPEIYKVFNANDIEISDKTFEKAGIGIKIRHEEKNGIEEYSFVEIYNGEEGKKVSNIPTKIASAKLTSISIAFKVADKHGIIPISLDEVGSPLYAYLPMSEQRFKFPFYVNADFVLSSSREGLQVDNKWNIYLFNQLGREIVSAVASIANLYNPYYLGLLPRPLESNQIALSAINSSFNRNYLNSLANEEFILDDSNKLRRQEEILLDETGLSEIIGQEMFIKLIGSSKRLPNSKIDSSPLRQDFFDKIEVVNCDVLNERFNLTTTIDALNEWLTNPELDKEKADLFFDWLLNHDELDVQMIVNSLRIIPLGGETYSLNNLPKDKSVVLVKGDAYEISDLLLKLQIECNTTDLSTHGLSSYFPFVQNTDLYQMLCETNLNLLTYEERLRLFRSLEKWKDIGDVKLRGIRIFKSTHGNLLSFNETLLCRTNMPEWYSKHVISNKELCVGISKYLPGSYKDSFDKAFRMLIDEEVTTVQEFYNYFEEDKLWGSSNSIDIINHYGCNEEFIFIIENSDTTSKQLFIDKIDRLDLYSEKEYSSDAVEYRLLQLAISCDKGSILRDKTYIDGIKLSKYAVSNVVTFAYKDKCYELTLSQILPRFSSENALGKVVGNFSGIQSINTFFIQEEINKGSLLREFQEFIRVEKRVLNWMQVSYIALVHLVYNQWSSYDRQYTFLPEGDDIIKIFDNLIDNGWIELMKPFVNLCINGLMDIKGKYFDSDVYTLPDEQVANYIKSWLSLSTNREKRTELLISLGAYSDTSNEIKRRKRFLGDTSADADWSISGTTVISFCNWLIKTQDIRNINQQQEGIIKTLAENAPRIIIKEFDLSRMNEAYEYDDDCYKTWSKSSPISIYLLNGNIPRVYKFSGTILLRFEEGTSDYVESKKAIYVNSNCDIESEMMTMAGKYGVPFTKVNWQELFSVNRSALKREQEENARLRKRLQDIEDEQSDITGRKLKRHDTDIETQKELNRAARIRAKEYLIGKGYDCQNWDVDVPSKTYHTTKNGESIDFVVASSRGGQIYLHPYKFAVIMESPKNLLLVDDGKIVRGLSFEEAFKGNHDVNLVFDVDSVTPKKMAEIANEMQFYPKANFVIENPDYSISDELRSFGLSEKHEGQPPTGLLLDDIFDM